MGKVVVREDKVKVSRRVGCRVSDDDCSQGERKQEITPGPDRQKLKRQGRWIIIVRHPPSQD